MILIDILPRRPRTTRCTRADFGDSNTDEEQAGTKGGHRVGKLLFPTEECDKGWRQSFLGLRVLSARKRPSISLRK